MKKQYHIFFLSLFCLSILSACTESPEFEQYTGAPLQIAIIGEVPEIEEDQVSFTQISFDQMANAEADSYDAVFIGEIKLPKAAESRYADVYLQSGIPFFFIGTDVHFPFTEKGDSEYGKEAGWEPGRSYANGILASQENGTLKTWAYGLHNDEKTDGHMKAMYSAIFRTIEEQKKGAH